MTLTTGRWTEEQIAEIRKRSGGSARTIGLAVPPVPAQRTAYQQPTKEEMDAYYEKIKQAQFNPSQGCCGSDRRAYN